MKNSTKCEYCGARWGLGDHQWIFIDDGIPPEGEYVLAKSGEDSPLGITRFINGEWEIGSSGKRIVYTKNERLYTSASAVFWMRLPEKPAGST